MDAERAPVRKLQQKKFERLKRKSQHFLVENERSVYK